VAQPRKNPNVPSTKQRNMPTNAGVSDPARRARDVARGDASPKSYVNDDRQPKDMSRKKPVPRYMQ